MKPFFLLITLFFVLATLSYGATLECFDDGSIKIEGIRKRWPITAQEKGGKSGWFEVPGEYRYNEKEEEYTFFSDEALFVSQKGSKYSLKTGKYKYTAKCPPFKFSCRIFNMSVDYCYTRKGIFISKFMVYNYHFDKTNVLRFTHPFMLWYEVVTTDGKRYVHAADRFNPEIKEINITLRKLNAGSKFVLSWLTDREVEEFYIKYNDCRQDRYNFYKRVKCTEAAACTISRDCFDDEYCQESLCEKLDCEECQYMANHTCFNYGCCLDEECGLKERCTEHACIELNCSREEGILNRSCAKLECAFDEKVEEHACVKLECAEGESAVDHACLKLECKEDEFISGHACVKLDCGWLKKAANHGCINYFNYFYHRLKEEK